MSSPQKAGRGRTLNKIPELSTSTQRKRTPFRRFLNWSLAPIILAVFKLWYALGETVVVCEDGSTPDLELDSPYVFAGWHEQLFNAFHFMGCEVRRGRRAITLISPSIDGDLISNIAMLRGSDVVRGSATRSGFAALRTLISAMRKDGCSSFVVTDGPKGPVRESKSGAVMLARMSRAQLVPLVCVASPERRLGTWDRLRVPSPFAKKVMLLGTPRTVPRDLDEIGIEIAARDLDLELAILTTKAEAMARGKTEPV